MGLNFDALTFTHVHYSCSRYYILQGFYFKWFFLTVIFFSTARAGTQVVIPFRGSEDDVRHIRVMGELGQIVFMVGRSSFKMLVREKTMF